MDLSPVPCTGPEKDVMLTAASFTLAPAISRNLSDMINTEKGNGRYTMKVKISAILTACS